MVFAAIRGARAFAAVFVGVSVLAALAPASAAASPSYAVLDFGTAETDANVDPWSFGLADFFAAALSERGGQVLERRALRSLLAERGLERAGLTATASVVREQFPHVRYLVKGVVDAASLDAGGDRFRLSISVLDTESGVSALDLSGKGSYPSNVAEVLDDLADRMLAKLPIGPAAGTPRARLWGMTESPDVAVQFYKGLDHLVHGRPEFAAEYFRQAQLADHSFWLAAAWRMRAYEQLGLHELAAYVRKLILEHPRGHAVFQALAPSLAHERDQLVVALARTPGADAGTRALEQRVREALTAQPGLSLFSAAWIRDLADELDLRLSGELAPRALEKDPWLAADAVVRVRREGNATRLELIDALSGELVARAETRANPVDAAAISQLVARLAEQPRQQLRERGGLHPKQPLDYTLPPGDISFYTRQGYAYLLRDFADHPADPVRIARHIEVHSLHSHAQHVPGTYDMEWRYVSLLWKLLIARVGPNHANAPNWLSLALWKLRLHGNIGNADLDHPRIWFNQGKRVPPLEKHFARLLRDHPQSLAALCVRYAIGLDHLKWGRQREGTDILLEVADALATTPAQPGGPGLTDPARASVFFITAVAAQDAGDSDLARHYARKAARASERIAEGWTVEPVVPVVSYIPPGRAGHANGSWTVQSMTKTIFVNGELRFRKEESLVAAIAQLAAGSGDRPAERSLGDLYVQVLRLDGAAGVDARLDYLRRVVREMNRGSTLHLSVTYTRPMDTLVPWLDQHVPDAQRAELESVVSDLVAALRASRPHPLRDELLVPLLAAAHLDNEIEVIADRGLASRSPTERSVGAIAKSGLIAQRADPASAARFLESELGRFERDFPRARSRHYLDLAHACAQAFEAASDRERAALTYRHILDAPLFSGEEVSAIERNAPPQRATLRFLLARVERERGNDLAAADLFKRVIESTEAHPDWQLYYSGHGSRSIGTLGLYRAAVKELGELRTPPASP